MGTKNTKTTKTRGISQSSNLPVKKTICFVLVVFFVFIVTGAERP